MPLDLEAAAAAVSNRKLFLANISHVTTEYFYKRSQNCSQIVGSSQSISVGCFPPTDIEKVREASPECQTCLRIAGDLYKMDVDFDTRLAIQDNRSDLRLRPDDLYNALAKNLEECKYVCKTCVIEDTSQRSILTMVQNCQFSAEKMDEWRRSVAGDVASKLYQRTDWLGSLMKSMGLQSQEEVATLVSTRIRQSIGQETIDIITNAVQNTQDITVRSLGDGTVLLRGVHQNNAIEISSRALVEASFGSNVITEEEWNQAVELWKETVTLDPIGKIIERGFKLAVTTVITTFQSAIIGVIIACATILFVIIVGIATNMDMGSIFRNPYGKVIEKSKPVASSDN